MGDDFGVFDKDFQQRLEKQLKKIQEHRVLKEQILLKKMIQDHSFEINSALRSTRNWSMGMYPDGSKLPSPSETLFVSHPPTNMSGSILSGTFAFGDVMPYSRFGTMPLSPVLSPEVNKADVIRKINEQLDFFMEPNFWDYLIEGIKCILWFPRVFKLMKG